MSSTALSYDPAALDELAAHVMAGVERDAVKVAATPFFLGLMEQVEKRAPASRRYTGAEFFLREPEKFKQVVGYLAEGRGLLWIADRVGCSHHTASAVRDYFPRAVAMEKERLADRCTQAASLMVDQIIEQPEKVPAQAWGLVAAQLIDKAAVLRGGPSLTVEHRHTFSHDDYLKLVATAPAAPIDVASEALPMGYVSGESSPMGAEGDRAAGLALAGAEGRPEQGVTDSSSVDLQRGRRSATRPAPADQAAEPAGSAPAGVGEGGVSPADAGGLEPHAF